jgi:hypothetical protein
MFPLGAPKGQYKKRVKPCLALESMGKTYGARATPLGFAVGLCEIVKIEVSFVFEPIRSPKTNGGCLWNTVILPFY